MAKDDKNLNLFQKLTRLFRSGPVVRRKIRNLDTTVAVADKSKSSGALLFQKSMAPTYATITANAYNLSERLMRYQDFGEMEYCLHGDTKIAVPGGYKTISELAAECEGKPDHTFLVYSYDHNLQRIIPAWGKQARHTRTDHAYTVTFDNGQQIIGTPNHRLMKRDGTFCKIEDLKAGDAMMPFYRRDLFNGCKEEGDGYRWIYTMDRRSKMNGWVAEHRVIGEMLKGSTLDKNEVVHHRNFVKFDNRPENLEVMTEEAHLRLHSQMLNGVKWSERNAEWIQAFKVNHSKFMTENNPSERKDITFGRILEVAERTGFNSRKMCEVLDTDPNTIKRRLRNHGYQDFQTFARAYNPDWHNTGWDNRGEKNPRYVKAVTFDRICSNFSKGMTNQQLAASLDTTVHVVEGRIRERGYKNYADFATSYDNLKVASVEYHGVIPLYDLTVDGYKNFATDTVISHNTPELAAALDIYADETCAQDEKGRVLHIYSDNEKIREVLEDLFYNTLNVEFNLRSWARNLPVHKDTVIPLLDGTEMTIENLAKKMKEEPGWTPWVYSIQDGTKRMVPGKVTWCDLTRKDSDLVRVWLDDGTYVDCTPDHEWILRDGSRKKAEDLDDGMSLMPFYRDVSSKVLKHRLDGYERVYDPCTESYEYTHRLVAEGAVSAPPEGKWHVVHHVNFDKRNNDPSNLRKMTWADHSQLHLKSSEVLKRPDVAAKRMAGIDRWLRSDKHRSIAKEQLKKLQDTGLMKKSWAEYNESEKHKEDNTVRSEASKKMWNDRRDELKEKLSIKFDDKCIDKVVNALRHQGKYLSPVKLGEILIHDAEFMSHFSSINEGTNRDLTKPFKSHAGFEGLLNKAGASTYISLVKERLPEIAATPWFKRAVKKSEKMSGIIPKMREKHSSAQSQIYMNHKVDRIERLSEKSDVYCMEVMGPSGEHDRHNFMVLTRFATGEVNLSGGICSQNCKYGDMFLYNDVSPEHGVINAFPIPVNEIEREENYDPNDPMAVRYRWVTLGNRTLENWEVTHFRLLGNDMFLPYGSSIIEPARRIWRQLILIEDAMLVYRVVRAPERRVFYIDVANIPPENVPMYVEEQRKNLRSSQVIDRNTGRVDLRYNPLCISLKTLIKLQDGREISLSDLITEWESGKKDQWVYSIDPVTNRYAPGKVVWAGVTRRDADLVRVWLDDDTFREVTPDHRFMMRDGTYRKAEELLAGDSLMPLYTKLSSKEDGDSIIGYEKVYDPGRNQYVFTHRQNANSALAEQKERIREELDWKVNSGLAIHHVNFNRRDNRPNNLVWMGKEDHFKFHASLGRENLIKWNKSEKKKTIVSLTNKRRNSVAAMSSYNGSDLHKSHNEARKRGRSSAWRDEDKRRSAQANMRLVFDNECMKILTDKIKSLKEFIGMSAMCDLLKNDVIFLETYARANAGKNKRNTNKSFHKAWLRDSLAKQDREYIDLFVELNPAACVGSNFKRALSSNRNASQYLNHKVIRVERVLHKEDTGCITVEKYHNFAAGPTVDQLGEEKTCNSWILLHNSVDEDYFIPVRGGESGTKIDTLAGGQNAAAVEDVAYIQKKLFAALKIPRAYLGYDESLSSKATLAQEDIRFSRTINVIQKTLISELNKLAIIHLYANGYDHEDLQNFTLRLSNPSTIAQQQKLELWRTKFEIAGSAPEGQMSKEFIRKEIWGLNDEQCAEIDEQRLKEKIVDATIESAEPEVEPGGGAEDVFAGGEEEESAEEEVPGDEGGEEELFAGDDVFDKEPDVSLLTASDDPTDDEDFPAKVSLDGVKVPVKAKSQLDRVLYNRGRIRHSGAAATHRPDFAKMTSHDNKSLTDPYDTESISSFLRNPFGEGVRRHKTPVGEEVLSSLRNMSRSARFSRTRSDGFGDHRRIISESDDEVDVGDAREHREVLVIDDDGSDDK